MIDLKRHYSGSIRAKIRLGFCILSVFMLLGASLFLLFFIRNVMEENITERLRSDTNYIEELIGKAEWREENGVLYCGEVALGDGTPENAFLEPFLELQEKTGAFSYTFVRCPDEGLTWFGDKKTGYQQGHYLRVSGSTRTSGGESILGTYMDKKIADILDTEGVYSGRANVVGEPVFCYYRALKNNEGKIAGVIVTGHSIQELRKDIFTVSGILLGIFLLFMVSVDVIISVRLNRWLRKLDRANRYLLEISTGKLPEEKLNLETKDELHITEDCINEMTVALKEKARISGELAAAANIQQQLLPRMFPEQEKFDLFAVMHPAREVGGDFYDFFMVDKEHLAVVIGDVSGKGVPASMFMAITKTLIKNYTKTGFAPGRVLTSVNQLLCEGNESSSFITVFMGILDLTTGKLTYANAGHNRPLIKLRDRGFEYLDVSPGVILGVFDWIQYNESELTLVPGDRLFLYTDGVTEAMDRKNTLYGTERLREYMNAHMDRNAENMLKGIRKEIEDYAEGQDQADDITMLMLDLNGLRDACRMTERTFPAVSEQLEEAVLFTKQMLAGKPLSRQTTSEILTAVDEIFTNISSYAYSEKGGTVRLGICAEEKEVRIRFIDAGMPFDPLQGAYPDVSLSIEERKIGGLGIFLVRKLMDNVTYKRQDGCNVLTMIKKYGNEVKKQDGNSR